MKKTLLLTGILLALTASMALASGLNINWGAGCWNDGTPLANKVWNCANNSGTDIMTCSFVCASSHPEFVGIELTLEGLTEAANVPAWWQMDTGECRAASLSASEDFTAAPAVGCVDMWGNQAFGGVGAYFDNVTNPSGGNNRTHAFLLYAVSSETPIPLDPDIEYYAAKMNIGHQKTVGTGACAGCTGKMIWGFYSLKVAELTQYEMLTEVIPGGNQCLTWQSSVLPCNQPVPARSTTWGQVKSLYR